MRPHKNSQLLPGYQDRALRVGRTVWKEVIRRQGKSMMETGDYITAHEVLAELLNVPQEEEPK